MGCKLEKWKMRAKRKVQLSTVSFTPDSFERTPETL